AIRPSDCDKRCGSREWMEIRSADRRMRRARRVRRGRLAMRSGRVALALAESALFVVPGPLVATQLALPAPLGVALGLAFLLRLVVVRVPAEPAERVHEQGQREQPGDDQGGAGAPAADEPPLR